MAFRLGFTGGTSNPTPSTLEPTLDLANNVTDAEAGWNDAVAGAASAVVGVSVATAATKRTRAVDRFNELAIAPGRRERYPVLFLTDAGCEGLDLKGARDVYTLEPHFNDVALRQVLGRASSNAGGTRPYE